MWVFLSNSMLDIAAYRDDPTLLLVRARISGDIENIFPDVSVEETPDADYRYRAKISRQAVTAKMSQIVASIGYDNFVSPVANDARHDAYFDVWSTMMAEQLRRLGEAKTTSATETVLTQ